MDLYRDGEVYGETCLSDAQAGGLGAITPGLVLREFRRLSWPESPLSIQPPGLRTAARRLSTDPVAVEAVVDLVHGRYVRALTAPAEADLTAALRRVTGRS